jgi:subtilisin-like proprotein convertase family protein
MKKLLTLCMVLAFVATAAFASEAKTEKGPEAGQTVYRNYDQSTVKALPRPVVDEREAMKNELEALRATINEMIIRNEDYSAQKDRANELMGLLFPARGASHLDQGGDACLDAVAVNALPFCDDGTTVGYTNDYAGSCSINGTSGDVVYSYTPTTTVVVTISLLGTSFDSRLYVTDGCPDVGVEVGCNDDNGGTLQSCLENLTLAAGQTYYIVVDGYNGAAGDYTIHISEDGICGTGACPASCADPGPVSDDCGTAIEVAVPSTQYGSTVGLAPATLPFCGTSDGTGGAAWYKVVGNGNTYTASTCEVCSDYDTKIRVYTCGCANLTCVGGNDDSNCSFGGLLSSVSWATDAGAVYYVVVHGYSSYQGNFGLVLSEDGVPSNGDGIDCPCHDEALSAPGTTSGNSTNAGNDCALRSGTDWIVEVSIPYDGEWRFSLCGSSYDSYLYLGTDCCLGDIASADDVCGASPEICVFVPQGLVYATIEGYSSFSYGDWTLLVEPCVPPVGSCCYFVEGADLCTAPVCAEEMTELDCAALGGVWTRDGNCVDNACVWTRPCICDCGQYPNSHSTVAVTPLDYPINEAFPTTCVTINVPVEYHITDLNVCLDLIHTFDGDLDIYLTSPTGTIIELSTDNGSGGDDMLCTEFDDEAIDLVTAGVAPFSGSFIPEGLLSGVDGENALGDWLLCITDDAGGDIGYIIGVCLKFEYDEILPVAFGGFDAVAGNGKITLNWNTLSENNVDHFELSRDGAVVANVAAENNASGASYSYVDNDVTNGVEYNYSLVSVDVNGARQDLATMSATPVGAAVVNAYALHQNYPNPFNPTTNIAFDMVEAGHVTINVYNVMGQKVAELVNGVAEAGRHTVSFDATSLSSGLYLYKMEANGFTAQSKMVLMK